MDDRWHVSILVVHYPYLGICHTDEYTRSGKDSEASTMIFDRHIYIDINFRAHSPSFSGTREVE